MNVKNAASTVLAVRYVKRLGAVRIRDRHTVAARDGRDVDGRAVSVFTRFTSIARFTLRASRANFTTGALWASFALGASGASFALWASRAFRACFTTGALGTRGTNSTLWATASVSDVKGTRGTIRKGEGDLVCTSIFLGSKGLFYRLYANATFTRLTLCASVTL